MAPSTSQAVVVAAAWMGNFLSLGCMYSFGVFLPTIMQEFDVSKGDASSVHSFWMMLFFFTGLLSAKIGHRIGQRKLAALGITLALIGFQLAALAVNFAMLYCLGLTGIGFNFVWLGGLSCIPNHFQQKGAAAASAIAVSGVGFGIIAYSAIVPELISSVGLRGTFRVLSACVVVCGCFASAGYLPPAKKAEDAAPRKGSTDSTQPIAKEVPLTRDSRFHVLACACVLATIGFCMPFSHLAGHVVQLGLGVEVYSLAYKAFGISSIVGRLSGGLFAQKMRALTVWMFGTLAVSLTLFGMAAATTEAEIVAVMICFGFGSGPMLALLLPAMGELFGMHRASTALGLIFSLNGCASFLGPIIAGYIADATENYIASFCIGGLVTLMAGGLVVVLQQMDQRVRRSKASEAHPSSVQDKQTSQHVAKDKEQISGAEPCSPEAQI